MTWEGASLARVVRETQSWARWRLGLQQDLPEPLMGSASSDTLEGVGWQDSQISVFGKSPGIQVGEAQSCPRQEMQGPRAGDLSRWPEGSVSPSAPWQLQGSPGTCRRVPAPRKLPPRTPGAHQYLYLPASEDAVYPPAHSENLKCLLSIKKSDFTQFPYWSDGGHQDPAVSRAGLVESVGCRPRCRCRPRSRPRGLGLLGQDSARRSGFSPRGRAPPVFPEHL